MSWADFQSARAKPNNRPDIPSSKSLLQHSTKNKTMRRKLSVHFRIFNRNSVPKTYNGVQWLIQDFPDAGPPTLKVGMPAYYYRPLRSCECYVFTPAKAGTPPPPSWQQTSPPESQAPPWQGDPPYQQTATSADGTHPTGMHSCLGQFFAKNCMKLKKMD